MTSVESTPSTSTQNPTISAPSEGPPQRKQLTKAERRELQEKQRAAKVAATASGGSTKPNNAQKPPPKSAQGQNAKVSTPASGGGGNLAASAGAAAAGVKKTAKSGKEVEVPFVDKAVDLEVHRRHQTRIFTHFVGKREGGLGAGIKGEIHPAIIRLGRQFADMQIVGANARCIATLVAFKTVI